MYDHKEKYIIDFTMVSSWRDIHTILAREFDFPDYYGRNWDAFWDCITDLILSSDGLNIEIIGIDEIYSRYKEDMDIFIETLNELKHVYNDKYANVTKIVIHRAGSLIELT
ncbi:MAG: barstar family protein [Clostridia bacterium]|nr:barstar family protein [Clostridia bacterium]